MTVLDHNLSVWHKKKNNKTHWNILTLDGYKAVPTLCLPFLFLTLLCYEFWVTPSSKVCKIGLTEGVTSEQNCSALDTAFNSCTMKGRHGKDSHGYDIICMIAVLVAWGLKHYAVTIQPHILFDVICICSIKTWVLLPLLAELVEVGIHNFCFFRHFCIIIRKMSLPVVITNWMLASVTLTNWNLVISYFHMNAAQVCRSVKTAPLST